MSLPVPSISSMPLALQYSFAFSKLETELASPALYRKPSVFKSGLICLASATIWSICTSSLVPVMLPPGLSRLCTRPAPTGSDTAENTTGISSASLAADCAVGVAIATMTSLCSSANCDMIEFKLEGCPAASAKLYSTVSPSL